jgi:SAM-dependent methyltransferase
MKKITEANILMRFRMNDWKMGSFFGVLVALLLGCGSCKNDNPPSTAPSHNSKTNTTVHDIQDPARVIWQKPEMVINIFGDLKDKVVADIGAGTGFFAFRLVPKCKKVLALDIDPRFINFIDSARTKQLQVALQARLVPRLVEPNDPQLADSEVDNVLIVNTYMYLTNRVAYLNLLKKGMKKGGKILIVDYKEKMIPEGPKVELKLSLSVVEKELLQAGFQKVTTDDTSLAYQYIITAIY